MSEFNCKVRRLMIGFNAIKQQRELDKIYNNTKNKEKNEQSN